MGQRRNYAVVKDAQVWLRMEECVENMEEANYAVEKHEPRRNSLALIVS